MGRTVTLQDRDVSRYKHICAFYNTSEELYGLVVPFLKEGYSQFERLLTIMDDDKYDAYLERLAESGIEISGQTPKQLLAYRASEAYAGKSFDPTAMLTLVEQNLQEAHSQNFSSVRTCGAMNWAAEPGVNTADVMHYESSVNTMIERHDCTCLCVYDAQKFSGSLVMDVLATHPVVFLNGQLSENPYYIAPKDFIEWMKIRSLWNNPRELTNP